MSQLVNQSKDGTVMIKTSYDNGIPYGEIILSDGRNSNVLKFRGRDDSNFLYYSCMIRKINKRMR